jgi:hypothetical protein
MSRDGQHLGFMIHTKNNHFLQGFMIIMALVRGGLKCNLFILCILLIKWMSKIFQEILSNYFTLEMCE